MKDNLFNVLPGIWTGKGYSEYPTISPSPYLETLVFEYNGADTVIHYNQKTWYSNESGDKGKPLFWDTGFIIPKDDKVLEIISCQLSGRIEKLRGFFNISENGVIKLELHSTVILNDEKTIRSGRIFTINNDKMEYELFMTTTKNLEFNRHLRCNLVKL